MNKKNPADYSLEIYDYSVFSPKEDNYSRNGLGSGKHCRVWCGPLQARPEDCQDHNPSGKKPPTGKSRPKFPSSAPPPAPAEPREEAADRRTRPRVTAFSRPPRLTSKGGASPAAPPLTLLLPGANTANQHPPPAPAGL